MKYNQAHEMFNDMMNFAVAHGMTSYQSDLMHDAVMLYNIDTNGEAANLLWVVKSNGCGTWLYDYSNKDIIDYIAKDTGAKANITFDGRVWTFEEQ